MGCQHSGASGASPKVAAAKKSNEKKVIKEITRETFHPCQEMFADLKKIMAGVTRLPRPSVISLVACLSPSSLPLVITPINYEEGEPSNICMPSIGICKYNDGRIICLGNIEILLDCKPDNAEFLAFLENILTFAAGPRPISPLILFLGLEQTHSDQLIRNMSGLGFGFERSNEAVDLSKYAIIVTMSDCIFYDELFDFVDKGGGLMCCSRLEQGSKNFKMNKILTKCGIGFSFKIVELPPLKQAAMKTTIRSTELERATLPYLANGYKELLMDDLNPDPIELETAISYLRFNLQCFERGHNDLFMELFQISMKFLEDTNYKQPDGMFNSDAQKVVADLLCDIMDKMSIEEFDTDFCEPFPGHFMPEKLDEVDIKLTVQAVNWHSTGLWLPAGIISEITIEAEDISNLYLQVGSHTESLLGTKGPWKRWPSVVQFFYFENNSTRASTPFGGLIYLVNQKQCKPQRVYIHITNVCQALYFVDSNPSDFRYLQSASYPPWGEIQTAHTCFTLPSGVFPKIPSISAFASFFDSLIQEVIAFTSFKPKKRIRFVFDYGLPDTGSVCSYPLIISHEMISGIFEDISPSPELFAILMMVGIISLPEGSLDPNIEAAFGALAAAHTFAKKWPGITPTEFTYMHMSPLFRDLWTVYSQNDPKLITSALSRFHVNQASKTTPFDESIAFIINEMASIADKDFSALLDTATNRNASQQFPSYHIIEDEEEEEAPEN
ncbi:hypothetical protein TRFO_35371 [Tritrichomonas foetus]|uniref:Peptidase M60 domain-containing protein n=1 Tax=Tritrichomonas foetus TaxID=1144522 RepID=A0A1J4JL01_9EUKA|nr:hypothetical protein TRFO_35371 [Tritrichomonas foetus]|eukprot:OHS98251.1 hypothetical protein TRFO_35371 [Tritrichomonas foetus]